MASRSDPYAVLGVARTASQRQIREAFRRLARVDHPDANPNDPGAERRFKRIARAYELIKTVAARKAYEARRRSGQFAGPGAGGSTSYSVDQGPIYHSDLGHHSDFYQAGDPLTIPEAAALVGRDAGWLRRAIRDRRLAASRGERGYLVRRRDVERLDRTTPRRRPAAAVTVPAGGAAGPSEGRA
jgi:curved DNA-binding protein CbpA